MLEKAPTAPLNSSTLLLLDLRQKTNLYSMLLMGNIITEQSATTFIDPTLQKAFQQADDPVSLQQTARTCINRFIQDGQSPEQLKPLIDLLEGELIHVSEKQTEGVFHLSQTALNKLSLYSPTIANSLFSRDLPKLSADELNWMLLVLTSGQLISKLQLQDREINAPESDNPNLAICLNYLGLGQADPLFKTNLIEKIKSALIIKSESGRDDIIDIDQIKSTIHTQQLTQQSFEAATPLIQWISSHEAELEEALKDWGEDECAWGLYVLSTGQQPELSDYKDSKPHLSTITNCVGTFGREKVLDYLNKSLASKQHTETQEAIEQHYSQALEKLDANSRKWLLLEMTFKNFPEIPDINVQKPTKEQLEICEGLQSTVYGCSQLWNNLYTNLLLGLGNELQQVVPYLGGVIYSIISQLPDEARLWLAMAISTQTIQPTYDINESHFSSELGHTRIRQMLPPELVGHFQFLAKSSPILHGIMQSALKHKEEKDEAFDKQMRSLPLYQKFFVEQHLKRLDPNTTLWLLNALLFNEVVTGYKAINDEVTLKAPNRMLKGFADVIIEQCHSSPEMRILYINSVLSKLGSSEMMALEEYCLEKCDTHLSNLTKDEKLWVYLSLVKGELEAHKVSYDKTIEFPMAKKGRVAELLYLVSVFPNLESHLTQSLEAQHDDFKSLAPTLIDTLGPTAMQMLPQGEFTAYANMNADMARRLCLAITEQLPEPLQVWLATGLEKGIIDTQPLMIMLLQAGIPPQKMVPLLMIMPNILALALKWPKIQSGIVKAYGGDSDNIQPLQMLKLDMLPMNDQTFANICGAVQTQAKHLQALSASHCGLGDEALFHFYHTLYGKAPIQLLNLSDNTLTAKGLTLLFKHPNLYQDQTQLIALATCAWGEMAAPDVMSYLYARYNDLSLGESADSSQYYQSEDLKPKFSIADLLLQEASSQPMFDTILKGFVEKVPVPLQTLQLCFAAIGSHNPAAITTALEQTLPRLQNKFIQEWLRDSLSTGNITFPDLGSDTFNRLFGQPANQNDLMLLVQITALLVAAPRDQLEKAFALVGGESGLMVEPLTQLYTNKYVLPENLQALLAQALTVNPNWLQSLTLKEMNLSEKSIQGIVSQAQHKDRLSTVNLQGNVLSDDNMNALCSLLTQNPNVHHLNVSQCSLSDKNISKLIATISHAKLESLSLQNKPEAKTPSMAEALGLAPEASEHEAPPRLNLAHFKALAAELQKSTCTLRSLDVSYNLASIVGYQYLFKAIQSNPSSQLTRLCLNQAEPYTPSRLKKIADFLTTNTTLNTLEIQGEIKAADDLALVRDALKRNFTLHHLTYSKISEADESAGDKIAIQAEIEKLLERNRQMLPSLTDNSESNSLHEDIVNEALSPPSTSLLMAQGLNARRQSLQNSEDNISVSSHLSNQLRDKLNLSGSL